MTPDTPAIPALRAIPLFATLDEPMLAALAAQARWRTFAAGETVFLEGEPAAGLYFLQSGWLKVVKVSPSGREQVIKYLEPRETFNEIGAFSNQPNPATAVALEDAGVWLIQREGLMRLLAERPSFAQHLIEKMADRVQHLVELISDLSLRPVTGRLARLLLAQAVDEVVPRPRWYTQAELAARLGAVPDVIQRALRRLADDGVIIVERQQIRIQDQKTLEQIAVS
ncbi:MAG: Crp/Fnr family transcriptional regulator [Anaerolineae bacterium]